jgi:copper homeostasis protein
MKIYLEICAGSMDSALAARAGGADRIELCASLEAGGTTPSPGIILQAVQRLDIPVFVLIRPRPGDFLYSEDEFEAMKKDVLFCRGNGVKGVVIGMLKSDRSVDMERCSRLIELARPMEVTFHRAFDMTAMPFLALEDIISLGCSRILTSGRRDTAADGAGLIHELVCRAAGRISIMPGGGVNEGNIAQIIKSTGASEIHGSFRSAAEGADDQSFGSHQRMETDPERVSRALTAIRSVEPLP